MQIFKKLKEVWKDLDHPFIISDNREKYFNDLLNINSDHLNDVKKGDIVLLIGDFDDITLFNFFKLIEIGAIIVPVIKETKKEHKNYCLITSANKIISGCKVDNIIKKNDINENILLKKLKVKGNSGIIFFSSGTTGKPKAILHDINLLFKRFNTPRKSYRTVNFLMFDHMGGINTLLHTLFNGGTIITLKSRKVKDVLDVCNKFKVEVLPATPTFLRMMLISGFVPKKIPSSLKIISYGTEQMDETTLTQISKSLPNVDFRQTYGLSEFSVLRAKSKTRSSLFFKLSGEGLEKKIYNKILYLRSKYAMVGYLNDKSPFDSNGWYNTKDVVEQNGDYIKIIGRKSNIINVAGLKFMASDVENVALENPKILNAKAYAKSNPLTGQHVEIIIELKKDQKISLMEIKNYFKEKLSRHMNPQKILFNKIKISHRFKKK
ncbi:fatty acid--CoA ligase family protein [Pelagibacterales bacterium]|nr:fatty acid--CoA ligase family protein [Pelagibacterales bacterium]